MYPAPDYQRARWHTRIMVSARPCDSLASGLYLANIKALERQCCRMYRSQNGSQCDSYRFLQHGNNEICTKTDQNT